MELLPADRQTKTRCAGFIKINLGDQNDHAGTISDLQKTFG